MQLPVTALDFVKFCEVLIQMHESFLDQISKGQRPSGSEEFHKMIIENCNKLIPRITELNHELIKLMNVDWLERSNKAFKNVLEGPVEVDKFLQEENSFEND